MNLVVLKVTTEGISFVWVFSTDASRTSEERTIWGSTPYSRDQWYSRKPEVYVYVANWDDVQTIGKSGNGIGVSASANLL